MVTASEGNPSPVIRKPLSTPATAPISTQSGMIVWIDMSWFQNQPISELVRPRMLATERSIFPVMMMEDIGRATRMIGIRASTMKVKFRLVPKLSTVSDAITSTAIVRTMIAVSQVANRFSSDAPDLSGRAARSISDMGVPLPQRAGDPHGDQPVGADGQDDQRTDDGLLPELVDVEHREGATDHREQQRAEPGAPHRAAAAEDRDTADHHRGHHVQLVPGAGRGVDRAEPGGEQHPGQAGQRAGEDERAEQVAGDLDAGQFGGLRAGAH